MNEPTHRNRLNLQRKFALFNFIKRNHEPICNPTSETYKTLDEWAALASMEIGVPIKSTVLSRYAESSGHLINTNLRRALGTSKQSHQLAHLKPTLKYATLCSKVTHLETRLASLEAQLGIQQPESRS